MTCRLCGQDRPLRRSHIIPDRFTRKIQGDHAHLKIIGWDEAWSKRLPGGVYEPDFLCDECEGRTAIWEAEAARVFINESTAWQQIMDGESVIAWSFVGADMLALRMFFVQLLLKATLSTIGPFEKVQLGPYTNAFRKAVLTTSLDGFAGSFGVVLTRYSQSQKVPGVELAVQLPVRGYLSGCNIYWLALNGFGAFVRVDQRRFGDGMEKIEVGMAPELIALQRTFDDSKGIGFLYRLADRVQAARKQKGWKS